MGQSLILGGPPGGPLQAAPPSLSVVLPPVDLDGSSLGGDEPPDEPPGANSREQQDRAGVLGARGLPKYARKRWSDDVATLIAAFERAVGAHGKSYGSHRS